MNTLSEYLLKRGINLTPADVSDVVLSQPDLLEKVAVTWGTGKGAIMAVIQARIDAIKQEILDKARPEEVIVLRQSFVELGALIDDFVKYDLEYKRQNPDKTPSNAPPVIVEDGKEGSL